MPQVFRAYQDSQEPSEQEPSEGGEAMARDKAAGFDLGCEDLDLFCETHVDLASPAAIRRKQQMQRRLAFVHGVWNDANKVGEVIASGRYLKLCHLTEWISDSDERAWVRMKNEILAARRGAMMSSSPFRTDSRH